MRTRRAILPDVETIYQIVTEYAHDGTLLPRTIPDLCENIRDFFVVENEDGIHGCGALHLYGPHLAEIRSIAVFPSSKGLGAGRLLVDALLAEADHQRVRSVCLFTRIPEFFRHMGFNVAQREDLPDKIYKDCLNCSKLHCCDEVAMVRGELPEFAILAQPSVGLVRIRQ